MGVLGAFHVTRTIGLLTLTVFMAVLDGVVFARDFQHFDFEKINLKENETIGLQERNSTGNKKGL